MLDREKRTIETVINKRMTLAIVIKIVQVPRLVITVTPGTSDSDVSCASSGSYLCWFSVRNGIVDQTDQYVRLTCRAAEEPKKSKEV